MLSFDLVKMVQRRAHRRRHEGRTVARCKRIGMTSFDWRELKKAGVQ